jgi:uncharacterized protein (DUF1697 family)
VIGYIALLRGINVGGNNKIPMADLRACLEELGLQNVRTYIQSGNVLFESDKTAEVAAHDIEQTLAEKFKLAKSPIKVLVLTSAQLKEVVEHAPEGFGTEPDKYKYDVIFLMDKSSSEAMEYMETNPEVDTVWPGNSAVYHRRLNAKLTRSRMSKVVGKPIYKYMTIRNWNTTTKLLSLIEAD